MSSASDTQRIAVGVVEVVDASGNTLLVVDGPNRKVQVPSGTVLDAAGLNLSTTELGYLDGVTAGTAAVSKVVVLDASGKIDTIDLTAFKVGGTSVTSTAAELNYNDVTTAGVGQVSKAAILDASGDFTMPDNGHFKPSIASVAAAGTNAATATALADENNLVTGADGAKGVALPAAATNLQIRVINDSRTYALFVYPLSGGNDLINELPEDQRFILAPGNEAIFTATSGTQWWTDKRSGNATRETHFELFDDFLAAAIDTTNNWIVFDGTDVDADLAATVAGVPEGAIRMGSGDGNGADDKSVLSLILLAKGALISLGQTVFECRVSFSALTGITWGFGLGDVLANATEVANYTVDSGTVADDAGIANAVSFVFSTDATAATKWQMASTNAGTVGAAAAEAALASGPAVNTYQTLRLEVDATGDARFYVNGVLEGSRATAVATTALLIPYIWGDSAVDAQTVTDCDIDYILFQGKRPSSNA